MMRCVLQVRQDSMVDPDAGMDCSTLEPSSQGTLVPGGSRLMLLVANAAGLLYEYEIGPGALSANMTGQHFYTGAAPLQ